MHSKCRLIIHAHIAGLSKSIKKGAGGGGDSKGLYSFLQDETIKVGTLSGGQVENV